MGQIRAERRGDNIVITLPIETLKFAFENNPNNADYKVSNINAFADDVVRTLCTYSGTNATELGITQLEYFMDEIMDEVNTYGSSIIQK